MIKVPDVIFLTSCAVATGIHGAFNTPKLDDFIAFLRNNNVAFENSNGTTDTTNTRPDGVLQIYFQDPDGYWIEVNNSKLEDF